MPARTKTCLRSAFSAGWAVVFLSACLFETEVPPIPSSAYEAELSRLGEAPNPILSAYGKDPGGSLIGLQFAFTSLDYARDLNFNVETFHTRTGVYPALAGAYFDFRAQPERLRAFLMAAQLRGCVPSVTLDPKDYANPDIVYQKTFLALIAAGQFDAELSGWAQVLREYGQPVLLRFAHEMNGDWYPYGGGGDAEGDGRPDGPEAFIRAWRYVHDRFAAEGAANLIWVFCPNGEDFPDKDWNRPFRYYPGDAFTDLISVDAYEHHDKRTQSLPVALDPFLSRLGAFLRERRQSGNSGMPAFGLGEFGTNRINPSAKAEWYVQALGYLSRENRIQFHFLYNMKNKTEDFSLPNAAGPIAEAYSQPAFRSRIFPPATTTPASAKTGLGRLASPP